MTLPDRLATLEQHVLRPWWARATYALDATGHPVPQTRQGSALPPDLAAIEAAHRPWLVAYWALAQPQAPPLAWDDTVADAVLGWLWFRLQAGPRPTPLPPATVHLLIQACDAACDAQDLPALVAATRRVVAAWQAACRRAAEEAGP